MSLYFFILCLGLQFTNQICPNQNLEEELEIQQDNIDIWITYQNDKENVKDLDNIIAQISTLNQTYNIKALLTRNQFKFYSDDLKEFKSQNITAQQGQYFSINIKLPQNTNKFKIKYNIFFDNYIVLRTCSSSRFQNGPVINSFNQDLYRYQERILELDNNKLYFEIWMKEIAPSHLNQQTIHIVQYKDFVQTRENEIKFTHEFLLKKKKLLLYNQNGKQDLSQNIQQLMHLNYWYLLIFNQMRQENQSFNQELFIHSIYSEYYQLQTNYSYSFNTGIHLLLKNTIFSQFTVIQDYSNNQLNFTQFCQPDCLRCQKLVCLECKNNLVLSNGLCSCAQKNMFTTGEGECKYPPQILILKKKDISYDYNICRFGYYFDNRINTCRECSYFSGQQYYNCISTQKLNLDLKNCYRCSHLNMILKPQLIEQCYFGFFLIQGQCRKCPINCDVCELKENYQLVCLYCNNSLIINNLCQKCNLQNCELCVSVNNTKFCKMCKDQYSLNELKQCIYTNMDQFEQLKIQLLQEFQLTKNLYDENCELFSQETQQCVFCSLGFQNIQEQCLKCENEFIEQVFDNKNILGQKQYTNIVDKDFKLKLKQQKTSQHIQIVQQNKLEINNQKYYFNQIQQDQISFCHIEKDCYNIIVLDAELILVLNQLYILHSNRHFKNIHNMVNTIQNYNLYIKEYQINIQNKGNLNITVNQFKNCFQLIEYSITPINLNLNVNITITNNQQQNFVTLNGYKILKMNGIKFDLNQSFIFNIDSSELIMSNFQLYSSLTFRITSSYYVVFNDSQIINILSNQNLFYFDCNLYFYSSRITFVNSTFIESIVFGFYKSLQKGWITDYSFKNIIFESSRLFQAYNSSNIWCHFENFNFNNVTMSYSVQFLFHGNSNNDVVYTRAANFLYKKIIINKSILFTVSSANLMNFTFHNLELADSSKLFGQNNLNEEFHVQLYNISLYNTIVYTQSRIIALTNKGAVQIKLFKILEIQFILAILELELNTISSPEVEIKQYSIVNTESKLNLRKHMFLSGSFIIIDGYQIRGISDNLIQMSRDLTLITQKKLLLQNLLYDDIMITDNQLIFIQTFMRRLNITITNCYFNVAMIFQNSTQVIDDIKYSIIQVENNGECQFHLLQSQFKVQYVQQNIQKLRQKLVIYLKGSENLEWNYNIVIKDSIFNIINNDRNMAHYFSLSGTIVKIFNVGLQIKEQFRHAPQQQTNYSQIFMIFGNQISINTVTIYQIAFESVLLNIQDFALKKQSIITIANINVIRGSSIRRFINLQTKYATKITLFNISIQCYIIETLLFIILPQENAFLLLLNFTCDFIYYSKNDFLIQLYGSSNSEVKIQDFKIIGSHQIKQLGNGLVIHANLGYVTLNNFIIADFLMSAAQILADYIYIDKFKIINCRSDNNMITISEQAYYQVITILRLLLTDNRVYNNSLVYMDLNCSHLTILRDWRLLKNQIHKSLLHVKLYNQSYYPKAQIRFIKLKIIENICDDCILLESQELLTLKIIESFLINNSGNNIIQFNGLSTTIIDSSLIDKINDHRTILIRSNNKLTIINTIIFSIKSIIFQIPASYMEMAIINKLYVIKEQYNEQINIVSYKNLDPDILKLTFTNEHQLYNLRKQETNNKTVFLINHNVLDDDLMYFPSGQSLKEYRVLIINSKQYSLLLQNFQLFGFNMNNNLIIRTNTCLINLLDKSLEYLVNIQVFPKMLNENQTFMDLILVGNPYINDIFTFEAVCNFSNTTLVFQQCVKLFKCQLGEYFNLNKCQKCDIDRGYYSVQKRSQKCKPANHEIIEQLNHGLIKIKTGYWRPHYSNDQIEVCNLNPQNCLGGWEVGLASCKKGYLGALCQECDLQNLRGDGHYGKLQQNCYLCKFSFGIIFKVFFFVLFQLLTITIATRSQYMICQRYQNLIVSNRFYRILNKLSIDQPSVLIKQILNYFFYIQFISQSFKIDLQVESLVKILSNPISLANPHYDCMINKFETPELITKILIQLITPTFILIIFYTLFIIINRYLKLKFIFIFVFLPLELLFIVYSMGIFQFVVGLITHVKISGIWWIQNYRSIEYYDKTNIPLFIMIAGIIIILIIMIPMFILTIFHFRKNQLLEKNWIIKFGYLYQEYQVRIYYWEFIKMGLKVIFTTQTILLLNASDIKYIVTVLLIVFQSEIIKQFQPYYLKNLNQYDRKFHLMLLVTTLNFILVHLSNDYQQIILTLILYLVNAIYFLIIIKFMAKKYIQGNPILFDKLKLLVIKNVSENDSYQMRKSQAIKRFLMMKRYAKSQTSYKINQQQYTQLQMMVKSNILSNLSEAVIQEMELIPVHQNDFQKRNYQSIMIQSNQFQNKETELQSPIIRQITFGDLPQSKDNQSPENIELQDFNIYFQLLHFKILIQKNSIVYIFIKYYIFIKLNKNQPKVILFLPLYLTTSSLLKTRIDPIPLKYHIDQQNASLKRFSYLPTTRQYIYYHMNSDILITMQKLQIIKSMFQENLQIPLINTSIQLFNVGIFMKNKDFTINKKLNFKGCQGKNLIKMIFDGYSLQTNNNVRKIKINNLIMLMYLIIFSLGIQLTDQICINQSLEEELEIQEDNIDVWITYQNNKEYVKDLANTIAQISTFNQTFYIKALLTRNHFKFYSDDLKEFKSQNITAQQGEYFSINIKLPQIKDKFKIKYNIFFDNQIVMRTCSSRHFYNGPVINSFNQDLYRYQERILELDNNKLYFEIWIKEIAPSHLNQQTIHIFQYDDFVQTRENEIKFTHEFLLKKKKLLLYNQNGKQDLSQNIQQLIHLNYWYLLIFNQMRQENQSFNQELFIHSIYSEYYQLQTNYSYSFNTGIHLLLKNTIFSQFTVIQDYSKSQLNFTQFCQPDCLKCQKLVCLECKNNLVLSNGLCSCAQKYMFTTDEGECKYPPQNLILKKKDISYDYNICRFGYYFDNRINTCRECSYFSGQQYYNCISTQKLNLDLKNCYRCSHLNMILKPQLIEQCYFGFFLIQGQCRKCPINCDVCELNENYQLVCLYCNNSLIINNLCQKCNLQNCELCVNVNNAQFCKICKDQYSLNELKQCIFTNMDQFEQLKIQLQQEFQLTKNLYDENCELFSQETQQCVFCALGFQNIQEQCLKCENEFIEQVFDNKNILGQKQYANIVDKDFKLKLKQSKMANNQKCYNDTSQHIQIVQQNKLEINNQKYYFNQIQQDQISFCQIDKNCYNFIVLDAELVLVLNQFYILHSNRHFKNIYNMVNTIQNYNLYIKEYYINIQNKGNLNITANQFKNFFQLIENSKTSINLNLDVNITITNNQQYNFVTLNGYKTLKMNGIKFDLNQSVIFNIDSSELIMSNFQIQSSLTFVITSSHYVVFNDSKIINVNNENDNLFYFYCNLYFQSSRIIFINSTFMESTVFGFYKSLQKGYITDYTLRNIIFEQSSLFHANYSLNSQCHFENFNFNNIEMSSNSVQFFFYGDDNNDVIYARMANFTYKKIILNGSILFFFTSAQSKNFTFHNLEMNNKSTVFVQTKQGFHIQLFNITLYSTIVDIWSRILGINNKGSVLIKLFKIIQIQAIFVTLKGHIIEIKSPEIEINQYSIVNSESKLNLGNNMILEGNIITINDYQIRGVYDNLIQMNSGLNLVAQEKIILQNLIFDNIMITDNELIFIKTFIQKLKITITNCYFNIAMTFQKKPEVIDEIKSSIIRIDNIGECQFHLLQSKFNVLYIKSNISNLGQKLIIYLKKYDIFEWNFNVIIKNCIFSIINNDRNMAQYFSISGSIITIINVGVEIKENFKLDRQYQLSQPSIFMIFGNQITINTVTIYQIAFQSELFHIKDLAFEQQSNIQLANIDVLAGSQMKRLINLETKKASQITLLNISIKCYIIETFLFIILPQENTFLLLHHFTCDVIYYSKNEFLIKLYGSSNSDVEIRDLKIIGSHQNKQIGNGSVLHANLGQITLENFIIADFLMSAAQILANYIYIDKFKVINCRSDNNMITISEQAYYQVITILRLLLTDNRVYNNSLVYMDLNCSHLAIFMDWGVLKNQIYRSLLHVIVQNQFYFHQAQIRFVKLKMTENLCDKCLLLESQQPQTIKIIELILINNLGNNIIQFNGLLSTFIDSNIINTINNHKTILIKSDNKLRINNTIIFSIKSIIFQIPAGQTEISLMNKLFVIKEQYNEQTNIVSYKNLDPDILKLTFTNEHQLYNLKKQETDNKTVFLINHNVLDDDLVYFPSGQSLKEYRVLIINSKQYSLLFQNFQLFGFNMNNNLIIRTNTCLINLLDEQSEQLVNIQVFPKILNENQTFMDLILVGNPYTNDIFTFEAVCNFSNTTLVFQQSVKLFKCQLGEYFNLNKCQKCDIDRGYYSVQKRSLKCKPANHEIIEQLNHGLIKIKTGYWRPHYSNDQIEICNLNPQNCLGGWEVGLASCKKGYLGALCQECDLQNLRGDGHYGKLKQNCYQCKFSFGIIFKVFFFVLFQLLTITIATRSQYMICQRYQNLIVSNRFYRILNKLSIDQPSVLIKQIQNYFFYIQFISQSFQIDLQVESLVKILSNPISLANPHHDCMINNFETPELITKILIQLITPTFILIIFYTLFIIINRYLKLKFIFIFVFLPLELLFIVYSMGIFQFVVGLITHVKISGIWWIQTYRSIEYYDKTNIPLFIMIAGIIIILIIMIPMFILTILHFRKNQLLEKNWIIKFGYLYQEYQVRIYYWEFIKMGLKVIFTTQTMLLLNASDIKYIVTVLLIVFQSEIIKQFQPYYLKNLNQYDRKFHLMLLVTTLNFILVHLSNDYQQIILTLILYLVNAIYFLIIIKFMAKKYIQGNPILFDKLRLLVIKNPSENDSYQMKKSQTKKRFLIMKRYAKSQTSYKINQQQQFTQMQMMIKSNLLSNLSEAVNQEMELIPVHQNDFKKRNNQSIIIQSNQFQNNEIELQSVSPIIRQITFGDLPQSNDNQNIE